jgi:DNA-binding NtrC family response regulator
MVEKAGIDLPGLNGLSLLVIDDDPGVVRGMTRVLKGLGAEVRGVGSLREARLELAQTAPDAVLADLQLKDGTGLDLLAGYLGQHPDGAFYLITGHGSVDNAVEALRQGARHYFEKPVDPLVLARHLAADFAHLQARTGLNEQLSPYLVIRDPVMSKALSDLPRFAASAAPVLIQGETGHRQGTGRTRPARARSTGAGSVRSR